MPKTYSVGEFANEIGLHKNTVKRYCRNDELDYTTTPGGDRRIPHRELLRLTGHSKQRDRIALYARVSSHDQKQDGDLDRQLNQLTDHAHDNGWTVETQYTDIGSGLNEDRHDLNALLDDAPDADFGRVLITYEDRLTRFGFTYLERLLNQHGITITVVNGESDADVKEELVEDMMKLVASFSGKLYGMRSQKKGAIVESVEQHVSEDTA